MRAFLGTVFIVLLLVALLGWWRGWFVFDSVHAGNRTENRLTIDEGKIKDDASRAAAKVEELTDSAVSVFKSKSKPAKAGGGDIEVDATLVAVDEAARSVQVRVGDDVLTVGVDRDVGIVIDGQSSTLGQLRQGSAVVLRMTPTDAGKSLRITNITQ